MGKDADKFVKMNRNDEKKSGDRLNFSPVSWLLYNRILVKNAGLGKNSPRGSSGGKAKQTGYLLVLAINGCRSEYLDIHPNFRSELMAKSYNQQCPLARALDLIGERWTLLILRDLFLHNTRRFQDFEVSLVGIAPNTLSTRLKSLEAHGIISRRSYSEHPPRQVYFLTKKGVELGPILLALKDWGNQHA